jgi:hypothetical protein
LPVGTALALAEGTAGVELAGRAKKATATMLEALGSEELAYGDAGHKRETPHPKARPGIKSRRCRNRADEGSMRCHQKVGAN